MAQTLEPDQVGKREALLNFISTADAHGTPALSMLPKGTDPRNTLIDWQADDYRAPRIQGIPDGQDVTTFENKAAARALLSGRMMKTRDSFSVGDLAENVSDVAGLGGKEYAKAQLKSLFEIKRDIEATICGAQDSTAPTALVGGVTRGMDSWINASAQTDLPVPAAYRTPSASINTTATASLAESDVDAVLTSLWSERGTENRYVGLVGIELKKRFASFTRYMPTVASNTVVRQYNANANDKKVCNVVSIYEADGGVIELIPSKFLNINTTTGAGDTGQGYLIDPEMWELRFNRMPRHKELPDLGGGRRGLVDAIWGLVCKNPLAAAKFNPA